MMGRRVCRNPEVPFANNALLAMKLREMSTSKKYNLKTMDEFLQTKNALAQKTEAYDVLEEDLKFGSLLLGKGRFVRSVLERERFLKVAEDLVKDKKYPLWKKEDVNYYRSSSISPKHQRYGLLLYNKGECNEEHVIARGCGAGEGSRVNHYISVDYYVGQSKNPQPYVAEVKVFFRLMHPTSGPSLRVAVCDVYTSNIKSRLRVVNAGPPVAIDYPVAIDEVQAKLVAFIRNKKNPCGATRYFIELQGMTTRV
jgi:hypothetical protein